MTLSDPARYTHNYSGKPRRRSTSHPLPDSFSDKQFLDQVAETAKIFDVKKRVLPGPIMKTDDGGENREERKYRKEMSAIILDRKKEIQKKELKVKSLLPRRCERQLWDSAEWRERNKDLNQSFSKLSPIRSERKNVQGKGESFVLNHQV